MRMIKVSSCAMCPMRRRNDLVYHLWMCKILDIGVMDFIANITIHPDCPLEKLK